MRFFKKVLLVGAVLAGLLAAFFWFWMYPRYTVPVLMCHRFEEVVSAKDLLAISAGRFDAQMAFLKKNGYRVITVDDLIDGIKAGRTFPHNTVAITVDDGYADNYRVGYPVLKKYGFSAMIFLVADKIGTDPDFLTWTQAREMAAHGISFGAHTRRHVYLPSIKDEATLVDEIAGGKAVIAQGLGMPVRVLCYPTGGYTPQIQTLAKKSGYEAAFTTNRSRDRLNRSNMYELTRVSLRENDDAVSLFFKVSGYYNLFRKGKQGY